ncbi:MFS transporter [Sphingosinicella sp. GR2756]|uniref:MFS transporter n=1 Tax=Sphingosinicella rhizophila TaxID=3050082 RepID=A0ABU3Q5C7_9SPHN|nr:MFS transporter [Sphingosinicella sp. GR2756]
MLYPAPRQGWIGVALFVLAIVIAYIDRQILTLVVEPLRAAFAVSDAQIGMLQGFSIALLFAAMAMPIGRLIDIHNRRNILIASVLFWSAMTLLCGFAQNFWQLFLFRLGVGLGEAGLYPAIYSMIADMFPPKRRMTANVVFYIGALLGASVGISLGGAGIELLEDLRPTIPALSEHDLWRVVFVAAGAIGPVLALLLLAIREPSRKGLKVGEGRPRWRELALHLRHEPRLYVPILLGTALLGIADTGLISWFPTVLVRTFGYSGGEAGIVMGVVLAFGSSAGVATAAVIARELRARGRDDAFLCVVLTGILMCAPATIFSTVVAGRTTALILFGFQIYAIFIANGLLPTIVQEISPNRFRGQIVALQYLCVYLLSGLGVVLVGHCSDLLSTKGFGMAQAMALVILPAVALAGAVFWYGACAYRHRASQVSR